MWASGRIGYERPLEAGCCTIRANHYVPQGRKGCRKCRPMLSHYLRPNTWPQKFLLESSSLGLGQFSVFSVIGVGQPRVPLFKYLEEQQERGIPSSAVVSPTHRTTQASLTTIPNLDTLSNIRNPSSSRNPCVSLRSSREQDVLQNAKPESL